uniref:KxDL domain-containing protein n=1 Tax=Syphacia muris TaxID=451379 RepID=A0A0N5AR94_9BILA
MSIDAHYSEDHLVEALASQIDAENVATIINLQKKSLGRFEKTNEMLVNCCALSGERLEVAKKELTDQRDIIIQVKSDLESIFRRITIFKQRLASRYPDAYKKSGIFLKPVCKY